MEFGLSPREFHYLTLREFNSLAAFSLQQMKTQAELQRNVYLNAIYNSKRKKGQKFLELFEKKKTRQKKEMNAEEIKRQRAFLFGE